MRCFQTVLIALFATLQAKGAESESELMDAFCAVPRQPDQPAFPQ